MLDDFGAGYASIGYLRELSFDQIKLDGGLVTAAQHSADGKRLLRAVIGLCEILGVSTVCRTCGEQGASRPGDAPRVHGGPGILARAAGLRRGPEAFDWTQDASASGAGAARRLTLNVAELPLEGVAVSLRS